MKKRFCLYTAAAAVVVAIIVIGVAGCNEDPSENHDNVASYLGRYNAFPDSRDGQIYRTVKIGNQLWMAENMNYQPSTGNSWCYNNESSYCDKYGRLYNWEAAMAVCPAGWRLPDTADWNTLSEKVGGTRGYLDVDYWGDTILICPGVSKKLKSTSGWNDRQHGGSGNGTDDFGFTALPGGVFFSDSQYGGYYEQFGESGAWFTATALSDTLAYIRFINTDWHDGDLVGYADPKKFGWSVRCIKNN